ncbi:MAG: hypothetical protein NXI27_06585 [Alphaproteobacteria bacterium]|nr:hypothetical protein [Alphaproteobacteria bacterium]
MPRKPYDFHFAVVLYAVTGIWLGYLFFHTIEFPPALWDHFALYPLYFPKAHAEPVFSPLRAWIESITEINGFIYRPTISLIYAIERHLFGPDFSYAYVVKWISFLITLGLLLRRLSILGVGTLLRAFFVLLAVSHHSSPILMLLSPDIFMAMFLVASFEIGRRYFNATQATYIIQWGFITLILSFLAAGTREIAPILTGICLLFAAFYDKFSWTNAWRLIPLIASISYPAAQVFRTAVSRENLSGHFNDYPGVLFDLALHSMPIGPSLVVFSVFSALMLGFVVSNLWFVPTYSCIKFASFLLLLSSVTLILSAYGQTSVADRYVCAPAIFNAALVSLFLSGIINKLPAKSLEFRTVRYTIAITIFIPFIIGLQSIKIQLNAYRNYFEHVHGAMKTASMLISKGETVYLNVPPGEIEYNIREIFGDSSAFLGMNRYEFGSLSLEFVKSRHADFWFMTTDLEWLRYTAANADIDIYFADSDVSEPFRERIYTRLFGRIFDRGAPYFNQQNKLNSEFRLYVGRLRVDPDNVVSYREWQPGLGLERVDSGSEDHATYLGIGGAGLLLLGDMHPSRSNETVVVRGRASLNNCAQVIIGIRAKGADDISSGNFCAGLTESGSFAFAFDFGNYHPEMDNQEYEIFIFSPEFSDNAINISETNIYFVENN